MSMPLALAVNAHVFKWIYNSVMDAKLQKYNLFVHLCTLVMEVSTLRWLIILKLMMKMWWDVTSCVQFHTCSSLLYLNVCYMVFRGLRQSESTFFLFILRTVKIRITLKFLHVYLMVSHRKHYFICKPVVFFKTFNLVNCCMALVDVVTKLFWIYFCLIAKKCCVIFENYIMLIEVLFHGNKKFNILISMNVCPESTLYWINICFCILSGMWENSYFILYVLWILHISSMIMKQITVFEDEHLLILACFFSCLCH